MLQLASLVPKCQQYKDLLPIFTGFVLVAAMKNVEGNRCCKPECQGFLGFPYMWIRMPEDLVVMQEQMKIDIKCIDVDCRNYGPRLNRLMAKPEFFVFAPKGTEIFEKENGDGLTP
jgi:hypothetical protein